MKKQIRATILIGVSGSGKSTWVKNNNGGELCSTDKYVEKFASDEGLNYSDAFDKIQELNIFRDFTKLFYIDIETSIKNGADFSIDRTNLSIGFRAKLIGDLKALAEKYDKDLEINGVSFEVPKDVVKERLAKRVNETGKSIPEDVIENQFEHFEKPTKEEGFDNLEVIES